MTQEINKPIHTIRLGVISASIWRNEHDGKIRHNVTFSRGYKTKDGWKESQSFGRDDLPRVTKCADLAYEWIFANSGSSEPEDTNETANAQ